MKIVISALAAAALVVGVAGAGLAQTAPVQTNPNTKVYAYKKTETAPPSQPGAPMTATQTQPQDYLPGAAPHGSARWWEIMDRSASGTGGSE